MPVAVRSGGASAETTGGGSGDELIIGDLLGGAEEILPAGESTGRESGGDADDHLLDQTIEQLSNEGGSDTV
jgi:hypothetical protein